MFLGNNEQILLKLKYVQHINISKQFIPCMPLPKQLCVIRSSSSGAIVAKPNNGLGIQILTASQHKHGISKLICGQ